MFAKRLSSMSAASRDGVGSSAVHKPSLEVNIVIIRHPSNVVQLTFRSRLDEEDGDRHHDRSDERRARIIPS